MTYDSDKHHVGINGKGYIISQRNGRRYYQKKRAPTFVNKFGGGDSSYRDASFWQFFVQTNWRNGAKQLKFDDAGKFWKSADVDTTILEQMTLSKELTSAGQLAADTKVNTIESWKADAVTPFGDGSDGALTVATSDVYDADFPTVPLIDSACTGSAGSTTLSATNAGFASGQKVIIVQMRGTGVGNYEFRTISSYSAGAITLTEPLTNAYATGAQVAVMRQFSDITINTGVTLTAKAWDGTTGGIIPFYASSSITVTGTMTASAKGLRGGPTSNPGTTTGYQGEGSTGAYAYSTSANGSGGGGGYGTTGSVGAGGGGGHAAAGTDGQDGGFTGGTGGTLVGVATLAKMFSGGGGGAAACKNEAGRTGGAGGAGGGIIVLVSKTITVTGAVTSAGGNGSAGSVDGSGGGGGAGGSILVRTQIGTLGSTKITAAAGTGGVGPSQNGGAGAVGRIHLDYYTSYTGTTSPTVDTKLDSSLLDSPASTTSVAYGGASNGKVYTWDNATTWTEVFDTRKLTWFETTADDSVIVGDDGGTEKAGGQGFQVAAACTMKAVSVYLKKVDGTPGDITVQIETNSSTVPSGTLVNAAATGTIPAFTETAYAWYTVEFTSGFALAATTTYWITLKTAAAANDNNYEWGGVTAGGYATCTNATSTNGGTSWSAGTKDMNFKVLGNPTSVNCSVITKVGGTKKMYFGTGSETGVYNGDARLYSFDGTTWALTKIFATATESVINSINEFSDGKVYLGVGPQGRVQVTSDFSAFTVSKDIDIPQNPGYVYSIKEYNSYLYVGGGSPELVPTQYYNGFLNYNDQTTWRILYPFDFTVIKSMEFYDAYLFMGTYHGQLYVYDTSSLNPLFNFKDQYDFEQTIQCMKYYDDKLYIGLYPQAGASYNDAGIWIFERHGLYNAHTLGTDNVDGYRCMAVVNGDLIIGTGDKGNVYKLSKTIYKDEGWYQSSYFDANLPSINKLYKEVTVRHDALRTGERITVYYRFKEDDEWIELDTSDTVGAIEKVMSFPSAIYSKKITLKVEFGITDTSASPKLTEVVMRYTLYPDRKFMWTLRLLAKTACQLLDRTTDTRTSAEIRGELEDLMDTQSLYTFTDIDETEYTVLVNEADQTSWVIQKDDANEDEVIVSLVEA